MPQDNKNLEPRWYVIHTYSGYENNVKTNLEKIIEHRGLQDRIFEVVVPMEEQIEIKDGKTKSTIKKVFPGYVLIKMIMTDETWYIVRNTHAVTSFVGSGTKPVPLTDEEMKNMGLIDFTINVDYEIGDKVTVINGPLKDFVGTVNEINTIKKKVKVIVSMFGRETNVELDFSQIQKI